MDLEREVGRQILMSHFIVGRKIEIGGIFAGAGGGIDIDFNLMRIVRGLPVPAKIRSSWLAIESFLRSAWRIALFILALVRASNFRPNWPNTTTRTGRSGNPSKHNRKNKV